MDVRLDGKIVLITGAAQGVGEAIAIEAARSGAAGLMLTDRDSAMGQAVADRVRQSGVESDFFAADLQEVSSPSVIFAATLARFGRVDALVNAAAMTDRASLLEATPEQWNILFAVNARAPFFLMQEIVAHLSRSDRPGSVVNILSINAHGGTPELAVYSSTKAALALATKNAAHAYRFNRVRLNGINLGWTETPTEHRMQSATLKQGANWLEKAAARMPFGRLLRGDDVARLTTFLLSDASIPMTGALIDQDQSVIGPRDQ